MGRLEALQERVNLASGGVPQLVTGVEIRVIYAPQVMEQGSIGGILYALREECAAVAPLFAAGFAGSVPVPGFSIRVSQPRPAEGVLTATGAKHDSRLVLLLLRLVEAAHQTPPGAWQRLLDSMDGDEAEARAVFSPRNLARDVLTISVTIHGLGAVLPFDLAMPLGVTGLSPLTQAIAGQMRDADRMEFLLPGQPAAETGLEHGFLTLQNAGVFSPLDAAADQMGPRPGEPEIWREGDALIVEDWTDAPVFLAEYLRVLAGGTVDGVMPQTTERKP